MNIEEQYNNFSVYQGTRSKGAQNLQSLEERKKAVLWVSATKTYNALTSNHLVDWLNLYGNNLLQEVDTTASSQFMNFLFKRGNDFENMIVNNLVQKADVTKIANYYSKDAVENTIKYMKKGEPVIWSAPLTNVSKATYGIADLLIRSDMFSTLFKESPISEQDSKIPAPKLGTPFHYRVVEIKYCTIPLTSNGKYILNQPKFVAYKGQLHIYNEAIGKLQGYVPPESYMLGRRTNLTSSALDKLGVVDFTGHDQDIVEKTKDAINWYRSVQRKGSSWSIDPPNRVELFPNMSIDSGKWDPVKKMLAQKIGDITMLWNCGITQRSNAFDKEIYSINMNGCNSSVLGFSDTTVTAQCIDNIIKVNNPQESRVFIPMNVPVSPQLKETEPHKRMRELYVDFETFTDICPDIADTPDYTAFSMIFMIGVGWNVNGIWNHKTFVADSPTREAEYSIMRRFQNFVKEFSEPSTPNSTLPEPYQNLYVDTAPHPENDTRPSIFFWTADKILWNQALVRHNILTSTDPVSNIVSWIDLSKVMVDKHIAIKGAYDYKLKNIASAMKANGMIITSLEADCTNGAMAMIRAWQCYKKYEVPVKAPIMKDIIRYNEYDCKVMYDILKFLRRNIFTAN